MLQENPTYKNLNVKNLHILVAVIDCGEGRVVPLQSQPWQHVEKSPLDPDLAEAQHFPKTPYVK